jgi:hypothetical protein
MCSTWLYPPLAPRHAFNSAIVIMLSLDTQPGNPAGAAACGGAGVGFKYVHPGLPSSSHQVPGSSGSALQSSELVNHLASEQHEFSGSFLHVLTQPPLQVCTPYLCPYVHSPCTYGDCFRSRLLEVACLRLRLDEDDARHSIWLAEHCPH